MTVTLVRPAARSRLAAFSTGLPVRIRPAPTTDPPDEVLPAPDPARPPDPPVEAADPLPFGGSRSAEAHRATRRYLDLALEVLGGFRPIAHLRPLTDPARFEQVARQLARLGRPPVPRPGSGPARATGDRIRLRQLRTCEIHEGAVEAAAVLARGDAVRAMTLRLERRPTGPTNGEAWLCTHLAVL